MKRANLLVTAIAIVTCGAATNAAPSKKPSASECSAAATVDANALEYQIAEMQGRLSPAERSRWNAQQLAEFERRLADYKPKAAIARAVADKLVDVDTPDAVFDKVEAMTGHDREVFIQSCKQAYVG